MCVCVCWLLVKNLPDSAGDSRNTSSIPGLGRPPEEEMEPRSNILAWKIPWTEEPGGLQSTGPQRVGHDRATSLSLIERQ